MKKALSLALAVLAVSAATTGCVGKRHSFCLFKNLAEWNRTASSNEWVNEVIYLALVIVPAYPICLFADALVFNSIDFWTGDNPVKGAFAAVEGTDAEGNAYAIVPNGDGSATLTYKGQTCTLTRDGEAVVLSQNGTTFGSITRQGALATFTGVDGTVYSTLR